MGYEKLLEVSSENIIGVLQALKKDWPSSIHMYYFIQMCLKWKDCNPRLQSFKVYCCGAPEEELFLAVEDYQINGIVLERVMVHSRIKDDTLMKRLLSETSAINWSVDPMFEAVIKKDVPQIKEVCKLKNKTCYFDGFYNQVWLPTKKQNGIAIIVPPDMYITELNEEHVGRINDTWRYKSPGTEVMVRDTIVFNHGLGLFRKSDNKMVAWNTVQHFAGLGMLYTEEDERGKGYASLITLALAKYLVNIKIDPYACIKVTNAPSLAVYKKLGFEITDEVTWLMTSKLNHFHFLET